MTIASYVNYRSNTESLVAMYFNCYEEDDIDEVVPCKLGDGNLTVVTIAHRQEHAKLIKR